MKSQLRRLLLSSVYLLLLASLTSCGPSPHIIGDLNGWPIQEKEITIKGIVCASTGEWLQDAQLCLRRDDNCIVKLATSSDACFEMTMAASKGKAPLDLLITRVGYKSLQIRLPGNRDSYLAIGMAKDSWASMGGWEYVDKERMAQNGTPECLRKGK